MYSTPELLLVGAAQSLVLGFSPSLKTVTDLCEDPDGKDIIEPATGLYRDPEGW